jgi:hypothetical protein
MSRFMGLLLISVLLGTGARAEVLRWGWIGDTGVNCTYVVPDQPREVWIQRADSGQQTIVAEHLASVMAQLPLRDIFFLGDNFYPHGLEAGTIGDACVELAFTRPYSSLLPPQNLHLMPGNHDYDIAGSVKRQLDLSGQIWTFHTRPALVQLVPGLIDVIPFDSSIMLLDPDVLPAYQRELTDRLRESTAPWIVMAAHHPLQTIGKHSYRTFFGRFNKNDYASSANLRYRRTVEQAIKDSGRRVPLFVAGHDHSLQFIRTPDSDERLPKAHVVSGSGGKVSMVHSVGGDRWGAPVPGFVVSEIDTDRPHVMKLRFFDSAKNREIREFDVEIEPFEWSGSPQASIHAVGAGAGGLP